MSSFSHWSLSYPLTRRSLRAVPFNSRSDLRIVGIVFSISLRQSANEMVRRCNPPLRWRMEAAVSMEDHRHADSFGRHRPWQDYVSPCGSGIIGQGSGEEEVLTEAATGVHGEHADFADWPRSLLRSAFSWSS